MRIEDPVERNFYEREATRGDWSFRQLERMYRASTFERLEISKDKKKVRALMSRPAPDVEVAGEALKDPLVAEFLGLPEGYDESALEDRIFNHLRDFMLELGKGFTFYGRQVRCDIGNKHYYADLAFYNRFTNTNLPSGRRARMATALPCRITSRLAFLPSGSSMSRRSTLMIFPVYLRSVLRVFSVKSFMSDIISNAPGGVPSGACFTSANCDAVEEVVAAVAVGAGEEVAVVGVPTLHGRGDALRDAASERDVLSVPP